MTIRKPNLSYMPGLSVLPLGTVVEGNQQLYESSYKQYTGGDVDG